MSSLIGCSSSRSSSSSSSFRSSARYSCSSSITSVQTEASSSPPDPFLVPFLDQSATVLFGGHRGDSESFVSERETFGSCQGDRKSHTGGYQGDWSHGGTQGLPFALNYNDVSAVRGKEQEAISFTQCYFSPDNIHQCLGSRRIITSYRAIWVDDHYYTSADVSRFEPHDIVVMAFNNSVVIHAEKVGDDGCIIDKFTHKSLLPEDMDPLTVSGTLTPDGVLVISVKSRSRFQSHL